MKFLTESKVLIRAYQANHVPETGLEPIKLKWLSLQIFEKVVRKKSNRFQISFYEVILN